MIKAIKNWLQSGEITLLKLNNELMEDKLKKLNEDYCDELKKVQDLYIEILGRDRAISELKQQLLNLTAKNNSLADDLNKKNSEKQANFSEKIDSVKGFAVFSFEFEKQEKLGDNLIVKYFKSSNEAAKSYGIDGSNLTKRLKETGGNCVIKGIQFVLVSILK